MFLQVVCFDSKVFDHVYANIANNVMRMLCSKRPYMVQVTTV